MSESESDATALSFGDPVGLAATDLAIYIDTSLHA